jgi:hypothetical protein
MKDIQTVTFAHSCANGPGHDLVNEASHTSFLRSHGNENTLFIVTQAFSRPSILLDHPVKADLHCQCLYRSLSELLFRQSVRATLMTGQNTFVLQSLRSGRSTGGPLKHGFGLSGAVLQTGQSLPSALSCYRVVDSDLICTVPHGLLTSQQQVLPLHRSSLCDDLFRSG